MRAAAPDPRPTRVNMCNFAFGFSNVFKGITKSPTRLQAIKMKEIVMNRNLQPEISTIKPLTITKKIIGTK